MNPKRLERVGSQLVREISDLLLRKIADPRLRWVTVTRVRLTPDLREARVFIRTLENGAQCAEALEALGHAKGYLRRELGSRLELRIIPDLQFFADDEMERTERVLKLIDELEKED